MQRLLGVLALVWIAGCIAGSLYSQEQHIPARIAWPVLFAFLAEITFYLSAGVEEARRLWSPWILAASAPLPYLLCTLPTGVFQWTSFGALILLGALVAFWFRLGGSDLLLLILMAAVYLAKPFRGIYPDVWPDLRVDALGQLLWFRLGLISMLEGRCPPGINFSFVPSRKEWTWGAAYFLVFAPLAYLLAVRLDYMSLRVADGWWWKALAAFTGAFFVVAAAEEVFFRGVLQQRLAQWWGRWAGVVAASLLFGLVHLGFRHFPNWRHAAIATLLGLFCSACFLHGRGVRAPMVLHALTVAAWRAFLV